VPLPSGGSGKSESLLPTLSALSDDEVVEQYTTIYRELMNDDPAAWDAHGDDYHARLEHNYYMRPGATITSATAGRVPSASLRTSPNARWTGRSADSPRP
jgi:hypothetical protein